MTFLWTFLESAGPSGTARMLSGLLGQGLLKVGAKKLLVKWREACVHCVGVESSEGAQFLHVSAAQRSDCGHLTDQLQTEEKEKEDRGYCLERYGACSLRTSNF